MVLRGKRKIDFGDIHDGGKLHGLEFWFLSCPVSFGIPFSYPYLNEMSRRSFALSLFELKYTQGVRVHLPFQ